MNGAVLVSGTGTNLQSLLDARADDRLGPAKLAVVASNVPGCPALDKAERAGVACVALDHRTFPSRLAFDQALLAALEPFDIDLVILAGFMRLLTPTFLEAFPKRVINIHPALLPAFPGVNAQKQAYDYGVRFSGCTVHFVDSGMDSGPIIAQAVVPLYQSDTQEALRARILAEEHRLLPRVVRALAENRVRVVERRVWIETPPRSQPAETLRSL